MKNEDLQQLKAAALACDGWSWPDRRRDEYGYHHFGKRSEDGEFYDIGTIDASTYTDEYADDIRVLKFIRAAQPSTILALIAKVESLAADAERWRYIVENGKRMDGRFTLVHCGDDGKLDDLHGCQYAVFVDSAMAKEKA